MYPTVRFRPRRDGRYNTPKIYCYIRLNGLLSTPFSTNIDCLYKFNTKNQAFTGASPEVKTINDSLTNIRTEIRETFNRLTDLGIDFTAQILRDKYLSDKRSKIKLVPTFLDCMTEYIEHRREKENLEESTLNKITYSKQHFNAFISLQYKRKDFELRAITTTIANAFFEYLQIQKNQKGGQLSYEHCFRNLQNIVKTLDFAVSKQYLLSNPLMSLGIKNKTKEPTVQPLSISEIYNLMAVDGCSTTEKKVLDGFIIMCFTGFRHSDYVRFLSEPKSYIFTDATGFEYIELYSYKNRKDEAQASSYVPLHPVVKTMLERYDYKLPSFSDQIINRYMKNIAPRAAVFQKITTYTARKSCATLYGNMDGIEVKAVSKMLGHKKVSTTERHYFRVQNETVKRQYLNAINK